MRILRLAAIAAGAIILCSCRSLSTSVATTSLHHAGGGDTVPCPAPCPSECPPAACQPAACPTVACVPIVALPPVAIPCPICDGGDHCAAAKAVGDAGIGNLTAGDTVARFRPADDGPDNDEVHVATSNCTCVYAPKFASVRQVSVPSEEAAPLGPKGIARDELVAIDALLAPVRGKAQVIGPRAARRAEPGIAVEERLGPLAVDQGDLPSEADQAERPAARVADDQPLLAERTQAPRQMIGFDVPMAWTCVQAANVLVNDEAATVVAVDRGVATLRFEEPGRAELTVCKRASSDTARVGEELDFTIFLINTGDRALTDIVIVDALPDRLTLIPDSPDSTLQADVSLEKADDGAVVVKWRLREPLPAGASGFVRFRTIVR
jgi:uncharacterized repeat protein (TIGR01451 family)